MKVSITRATGLIGRALVGALRSNGRDVIALSRTPGRIEHIEITVWDPTRSHLPDRACDGVDAFVNLAGVGIGDGRWSEHHRTAIVESRVVTTRRLVEAMERYGVPTLINASAIGFYGPGDERVDESFLAGSDFLADVCVRWGQKQRGRTILHASFCCDQELCFQKTAARFQSCCFRRGWGWAGRLPAGGSGNPGYILLTR